MPIPKTDNQIRQMSISDEVYDRVLTWITDGVLKPGEKVVDKDLAGLMGVSRTPVREALRRLEDRDLIESSANRWTRVTEIPPREPEMIYPIIWSLEELALSAAAPNLTGADFKRMERANLELEKAVKAQDPLVSAKADAEFHSVFIERSGNIHLVRILEDLKIKHRRLEVGFFKETSLGGSSVAEHREMMAALRAGDTARALEINRRNWQKSLARRGERGQRA